MNFEEGKEIYLDNAATTRILDRVSEEMKPFHGTHFGNPNSLHSLGRFSKESIEDARNKISKLINGVNGNVVFTSGGAESNSLMARCISVIVNESKKAVITSFAEHDSMTNALHGYINDKNLIIETKNLGEDLIKEIKKLAADNKISAACFMFTNNEIGFNYPIKKIGEICHENNIVFGTDCVQAFCHEEIDVEEMHIDMMSMSSHKIHGPMGVGALYISSRMYNATPIVYGSLEQEFGIRGGTQNVPGIVGFGNAVDVMSNIKFNREQTKKLRKAFLDSLKSNLIGYKINCLNPYSKIISITIEGINAETLLYMLSSKGIYISAGSACRSNEQEASKTLLGYGLSEQEAHDTIRVSISPFENWINDVTIGAKIIAETVSAMRSM